MLNIQDFILKNKNWEELLSASPYCLKIKRKDDYIKFNYNQIESDFSNPLVQEARGIIFYEPTWEAVCVPFFKFFNYGESNASKLDWKTARILEKIDGSIISVWFHNGKWHISTNGTIDANDAEIQFSTEGFKTFYDVFFDAARKSFPIKMFEDILARTNYYLNTRYTYIFELVSPLTKVVISYPENKLYHIGTRDNISLQECEMNLGVEKPKEYKFSSMEETIEFARKFDKNHEGFVIIDSNYKRNKIKSEVYLSLHRLKGEGAMTNKRALDLISINEQEEFLSVFPEYTTLFRKVEKDLEIFISSFEEAYKVFKEHKGLPRKEYADKVSQYILKTGKKYISQYLFMFYDSGILPNDFFKGLDSEKMFKIMYKGKN